MTSRSLIQRSCVLLGLVALSAFLFYIGKGHTLLVDTAAVTIDGREFSSADTVSVSIDGREPESMGRAERTLVQVGGPRHKITIEVVSGGDQKVEQRFSLPTFQDTALVSVPAILGGAPSQHWVTKYVAPPSEEAPAEQMQQQEQSTVLAAPPAAKP
jgi:hypothetical protein